jgi:predicted ester cyclase
MSADRVRETVQKYVEVLLARGEYGRFFDDDIEFALMGTDQQARGAQAVEETIRFLHETAFDAEPEMTRLVVGDHSAAAEALFVGTHTGDFLGVSATGRSIRVPYSPRCESTCRWTSSWSSLTPQTNSNRTWPVRVVERRRARRR